ncbi:MAG TPA: ribonuclease HII [Candidatus Saccharimonadales bacterium]|nr:ribonuclease HII [Candidatus Saccharimonadales bacterium]
MLKPKPLPQQPASWRAKSAPNFELLAELQAAGYQKIIGIDEVGRGALAGPVIVAAVELNQRVDGITDSKLLPKAQRQTLAVQIHGLASQISFGSASVGEIYELGLSAGLKLAYERALEQIETDLILTDFVRLPGRKFIAQPQGDRYFYPTAAASIVAKVYRDQLMRVYHQLHPDYGWDTNVGYGTSGHQKALREFGPTALHRITFL